jgi:hypothetical protein
MFSNFRKVTFVLGLILALLLALMGTVMAHEGRELGDYEVVFGWRNEPAIVGYPNGPEFFIRLPEGVEGDINAMLSEMEVSLQVEVSFGPASKTLELRRDFRDPTHYIADLIPTRPGDYSFHVVGTIGDMEVDEVFTSADGLFGTVEPISDVTFPDELPSMVDLLEQIEQLEARIAALESSD